MLRIEFPSQQDHFQSPVHDSFLTFAHFWFSILNILTFWIFIVGKSFFSETLSKLNIQMFQMFQMVQMVGIYYGLNVLHGLNILNGLNGF